MAIRTTPTNVKAILLTQYDSTNAPDLNAFIEAASLTTDKVDACDADGDLSTNELEMIERFLAAHNYLLADQAIASEKDLDASATYQGQTGMFFESTFFGQQAMLLDTTGCLSQINQKAKKGGKRTLEFSWLGKAPSDQIDYSDRD